MPKGYPKPKETMTDLLSRFMEDLPPPNEAEVTANRPKLRAAYTEFKKRKKARA